MTMYIHKCHQMSLVGMFHTSGKFEDFMLLKSSEIRQKVDNIMSKRLIVRGYVANTGKFPVFQSFRVLSYLK